MHYVVLLRHASTHANVRGFFTGWLDEPINEQGLAEAGRAGRRMAENDLLPDRAYTSVLVRSLETCSVATSVMRREHILVRATWCLNERHYGASQGQSKAEVAESNGCDLYENWRRSLHGLPAPQPRADRALLQAGYDRRGLMVRVPASESLAMVRARVEPYWTNVIRAELAVCRVSLGVAHSNSLRAPVMHLECLDEDEIQGIDIAIAEPLVYEFDGKLELIGDGRSLA